MRAYGFFIAAVVVGILFCSCGKTTETIPEKSRSTHSFYVDNRLSEKVTLYFVEMDLENELSEDYQLNTYNDVFVYGNESLLVRYYDNSFYKDAEALNAFEYRVLKATHDPYATECYIKDFERSSNPYGVSKNLWRREYWSYRQKDKWNAEYTLVVDRKLIDELFD